MNITDRTEYMERPGLQKTEDGSQMSGNTKKKPVLQGNQSKKEVSGKYTDVAELSEEGKALAQALQKMNERWK